MILITFKDIFLNITRLLRVQNILVKNKSFLIKNTMTTVAFTRFTSVIYNIRIYASFLPLAAQLFVISIQALNNNQSPCSSIMISIKSMFFHGVVLSVCVKTKILLDFSATLCRYSWDGISQDRKFLSKTFRFLYLVLVR